MLLAVALAFGGGAVAMPQQLPPQGSYDPSLGLVAWVDPSHGNDNTAQVNDPDQPFRRLQSAIDTVHLQLRDLWDTNPIYREGVVVALPGVYGPNDVGPNDEKSSDDSLPIQMRDRVHVRGVGARRCILRGVNDLSSNTPGHYWPTGPGATMPFIEILLDFAPAYFGAPWPGSQQPSWYDADSPMLDVAELFDGFTFQGGDIQVHAHAAEQIATASTWETRGIVSNCVFDMRHGWQAPNGVVVAGPTFGVMMDKEFVVEPGDTLSGYIDSKLLIFGNTFVMAQWGITNLGTGTQGWIHSSLPNAVGIIDVTEPCCGGNCIQGWRDCDLTLRGVGNPGILNNLFRTRPAYNHMAMVGITLDDTRALDPATGIPIQSNAFATARVGNSNPTPMFTSVPAESGITYAYQGSTSSGFPALHDCVCTPGGASGCSGLTVNLNCAQGSQTGCSQGHPCPYDAASLAGFSPAVEIYDGSTGIDPGFVGEYLAVTVPGLESYVDWRLLPHHASRLKDAGHYPIVLEESAQPPHINIENGTVFDLPPAFSMDWDGEGHGNPRIVNGQPDIGFDEIHLLVMAGSYGNHSNSHNTPGALNPYAATGAPTRYVLVADKIGNDDLDGDHLKVNGAQLPGGSSPAWTIPPPAFGTPVIDPGLPADFQTKYISFNSGNPAPPTPWEVNPLSTLQLKSHAPLNNTTGLPLFRFYAAAFTDSESGDSNYFCTQTVVKEPTTSTVKYRSNMQAEYR